MSRLCEDDRAVPGTAAAQLLPADCGPALLLPADCRRLPAAVLSLLRPLLLPHLYALRPRRHNATEEQLRPRLRPGLQPRPLRPRPLRPRPLRPRPFQPLPSPASALHYTPEGWVLGARVGEGSWGREKAGWFIRRSPSQTLLWRQLFANGHVAAGGRKP